jgi:phage FluMu protein Com
MVITVYLHHDNLGYLNEIRCIQCGRLALRVNRRVAIVTNTAGVALEEIPLGAGYTEAKCRGCSMVIRLLFM